MDSTLFPIKPSDVIALTIAEFALDREMSNAPSLAEICRKFGNDANRALVCLIRYRALGAWCAREDMTAWVNASAHTRRDICEVAAGLALNDRWEFDGDAFCRAVDIVAHRNGSAPRTSPSL
ncbi:MAG TPA: hypothetical protein VFJ02_16065 [Vicinamibacterales bacterium]|nr:hypothetical protein [Vicinamibacterales bacterium]